MSFFGQPVLKRRIKKECIEVPDDRIYNTRSTRNAGELKTYPEQRTQTDPITYEALKDPVLKYGTQCYNASSLKNLKKDPMRGIAFTPDELTEIRDANARGKVPSLSRPWLDMPQPTLYSQRA